MGGCGLVCGVRVVVVGLAGVGRADDDGVVLVVAVLRLAVLLRVVLPPVPPVAPAAVAPSPSSPSPSALAVVVTSLLTAVAPLRSGFSLGLRRSLALDDRKGLALDQVDLVAEVLCE